MATNAFGPQTDAIEQKLDKINQTLEEKIINVQELPGTLGAQYRINVTPTSTVIASEVTTRLAITMTNMGSEIIYFALDLIADSSSGFPMSPGDVLEISDYGGPISAVSLTETVSVAILEVSK